MNRTPHNTASKVAAAIAFTVIVAACSATSDSASDGPGANPESTSTSTPSTVAPASPTSTEPPEPSVADTASTGVDVASFEPFALPDYAAAALNESYSSYLVEVEPGVHVHVLETGSGYPVYLQHGAPTSGFLFRKIAEFLPSDQFRLIMPTMVGLGFSSQVPADQHTLDNHARWMNEVLTQLGVEDVLYVGHDWGGPVGLGALERSPDLMAGAVLLNTTFGAPTGPVELNPQLQAILTPMPEEAERSLSVAIFDSLPAAQSDPASLSDDVLDLYRRPVAEGENPIGPLSIVRMAATGPEHPTAAVLREIDDYIAELEVPAEIVWGSNDPILGSRLPSVMAAFPDAPVTETNAGHFLQEEGDGPEAIAAAIQRVLDRMRS